MTEFRGLPCCDCLAEWLPVFEAAIGRSLRWFQLIGDAPASAGFHKGGGSADSELLSDDELRIARNMGGASWNRLWTGNYHAHTRLNGCPHNSIAQPQVDDLNAGRDGTGPLWDNAGVADNGPRDGVQWPLRTWREGIKWAREQADWIEMATEEDLKRLLRSEVTGPLRERMNEIAKGDKDRLRAQAAQIAAALDELATSVADDATKRQVAHVKDLVKHVRDQIDTEPSA